MYALARPLNGIALASLALTLSACATSSGIAAPPAPVSVPALQERITLPREPADLKGCFARAFPEIDDRDLTAEDVVRIIGEAKLLDEAKSRCGDRAVTWIRSVRHAYGKPTGPAQ